MLAIVFGLIFMILGLWGLASWWTDFMMVLKGLIPVLFVFGGLLAVIAGVTSIRDSIEAKNAAAKEAEQKK